MALRRGNALALVAAVGVVFVVGLFIHGVVGGVLLLLVAATMVLFSTAAWPRVRREGKLPRILIVVVVVALAAAKLAGKL